MHAAPMHPHPHAAPAVATLTPPSPMHPHPVHMRMRTPQDPNRHQAAGQVLLQFRQSPRPLEACRHILQHSHSAEAKFHAASTMREAVTREWASMGEGEVGALLRCRRSMVPKRHGDARGAARVFVAKRTDAAGE